MGAVSSRVGTLGLLGCCAFSLIARAGEPDFRKASWGMAEDQVLATETGQPGQIRESSGEVVVRYDSIQLGELPCRVVYILAKDRLVRAKYIFDARYSDPKDFIRDYGVVDSLLEEKYGKPVSERAFWSDDSLQDEPKSYLEQDRASATGILPSDYFAGLSLSAGHLKLYTRWRDDRTKISHGLTGEDGRITHQIEFLSVELEKFEREVRDSFTAQLIAN